MTFRVYIDRGLGGTEKYIRVNVSEPYELYISFNVVLNRRVLQSLSDFIGSTNGE